MKYLAKLIIVLLSASNTFGIIPIDSSQFVVTGQLHNFEEEDLLSLSAKFVLVMPTQPSQQTQLVEIDKDGKFEFRGDNLGYYRQVWFSLGDLYYGELIFKHHLHIAFDVGELKNNNTNYNNSAVKFSGNDGLITELKNTFTSDDREVQLEISNLLQEYMMNRSMDQEVKIDKTRKLFDKIKDHQDLFLKKNSHYPKWVLENERKSNLYSNLFLYSRNKDNNDELLIEAMKHHPKILSNDGVSFYRYCSWMLMYPSRDSINSIRNIVYKVQSEKDDEIASFNKYIKAFNSKAEGIAYDTSYLNKMSKSYKQRNKELVLQAHYKRYNEEINKLGHTQGDMIKLFGLPEDVLEKENYINSVYVNMSEGWPKKYLANALSKAKNKVDEINKSLAEANKKIDRQAPFGNYLKSMNFGAELFTVGDFSPTDFIVKVKKHFQDKHLIFDLWATWCAPCIEDMKISGKQKEFLRENNFEIIYLGSESGSSQKLWEKKIAELNVKGTHVFIDDKFTSKFMSYFELSGFPSYLTFSKEGKLIDGAIDRIFSIDRKELLESVNK